MKIKVSELEGVELDAWVARVLTGEEPRDASTKVSLPGVEGVIYPKRIEAWIDGRWREYSPSTDWSDCGPLIVNYKLDVVYEGPDLWAAQPENWDETNVGFGPTPQIAICRAVIASVNGEEFEVDE